MKRILIGLIRFYQKAISPMRPPCCRFIPTCSAYAVEAVEKYGAWKGGWLALRRSFGAIPSIGRSPSNTTLSRERGSHERI